MPRLSGPRRLPIVCWLRETNVLTIVKHAMLRAAAWRAVLLNCKLELVCMSGPAALLHDWSGWSVRSAAYSVLTVSRRRGVLSGPFRGALPQSFCGAAATASSTPQRRECGSACRDSSAFSPFSVRRHGTSAALTRHRS